MKDAWFLLNNSLVRAKMKVNGCPNCVTCGQVDRLNIDLCFHQSQISKQNPGLKKYSVHVKNSRLAESLIKS